MASKRHSTSMENFPDKVLSEIFVRLLAKEVAQMRCVCKSWNALLTRSSFVKSHLSRSICSNDKILLFFSQGFSFERSPFTAHPSRSPDLELTNFIKLPVNPQSNRTYGNVIGSVNGLICFIYGSLSVPSTHYVVYIWNPSLSVVLTLPPCSLPSRDMIASHFRFGYDPKTDDYKVVKLTSLILPPVMLPQVEVYSMRRGSWEVIRERIPSRITIVIQQDEVCVDGHDGHVHWLCRTPWTDLEWKPEAILAFDLSAETFLELSFPDFKRHRYGYHAVGVLGGKLCWMSSVYDDKCEVWVMEEYGVAESWVKHHVFSQFCGDRMPFGFTSHGEFLFHRHHFAMYDPVADKVKDFKIMRDDVTDGITKVVEYVDSLVWVTPMDRDQINCCSISQLQI